MKQNFKLIIFIIMLLVILFLTLFSISQCSKVKDQTVLQYESEYYQNRYYKMESALIKASQVINFQDKFIENIIVKSNPEFSYEDSVLYFASKQY